ncbi:MAG TPA: DegT/DnrJ/EryC1/StrS family aminotransferase [Devosia sp.]|nr:DegT/DnrJ/EryC1/StrS family aminotransferase [Devosia sp.]
MTNKIEFIDLKSQYATLKTAIDARIQAVLDHGQFIMGPEVGEMEAKLAAYVGGGECVSVSSGTEALLIALMGLGVGPGDEVITTPFTFAATAEVIALVGATPVFVDIEPDTCNIDARLVEAAVSEKTRAIMPVSLYGQTADMAELNAIAAHHGNITIIEDAAQSFGATYRDAKSCNVSHIGCTSFFPSKPLGCYGDGGAIFTSDPELAAVMRQIRVHGQERRYHHTRVGVGGRMDTIQAAVILAKLEQFEWEVAQRRAIGQRYLDMLAGVNAVQLPVVRPDRTCVWAQFTLQVADRDSVIAALKQQGIPTAIHYPIPLHLQPAYRDLCRISGTLKHAEAVASRVFSLPMHPYLDEATQSAIVAALPR